MTNRIGWGMERPDENEKPRDTVIGRLKENIRLKCISALEWVLSIGEKKQQDQK